MSKDDAKKALLVGFGLMFAVAAIMLLIFPLIYG